MKHKCTQKRIYRFFFKLPSNASSMVVVLKKNYCCQNLISAATFFQSVLVRIKGFYRFFHNFEVTKNFGVNRASSFLSIMTDLSQQRLRELYGATGELFASQSTSFRFFLHFLFCSCGITFFRKNLEKQNFNSNLKLGNSFQFLELKRGVEVIHVSAHVLPHKYNFNCVACELLFRLRNDCQF